MYANKTISAHICMPITTSYILTPERSNLTGWSIYMDRNCQDVNIVSFYGDRESKYAKMPKCQNAKMGQNGLRWSILVLSHSVKMLLLSPIKKPTDEL